MTTAPAPAAAPAGTDHDDDLMHLWCCRLNPRTALCGVDLTNAERVPYAGGEGLCIVCDDLASHPCEYCEGQA